MHIHIEKVQPLSGFAMASLEKGEHGWVLTRATVTSDDPDFHTYINQFTSIFLVPHKVMIDQVNNFLVVIHKDSTADVYINDVAVQVRMLVKRSVKALQEVTADDIADITHLKFPNVEIQETDKVIYCGKTSWRFGLFFDLSAGKFPAEDGNLVDHVIDIEQMELSLGSLHRRLLFSSVFEGVESQEQFEAMLKDGWFPFTQLILKDYEDLRKAYAGSPPNRSQINQIVERYDESRIQEIVSHWWTKPEFEEKQKLIMAGINAHNADTDEGYILAIKTLTTEIEGLLRSIYLKDTGKANNVKPPALIHNIIEKEIQRSELGESLLLPNSFSKCMD